MAWRGNARLAEAGPAAAGRLQPLLPVMPLLPSQGARVKSLHFMIQYIELS